MERPPFTVRAITPEEFGSWEGVLGASFGFDPRPEEQEIWKKRAEFDRYFGAFDGDDMVGTGGALTFSMAVPGGAFVPFGGITAIATRPTHRRHGVLTAVMRRLQEQATERGEVISALWAAESRIYRRFGYGVAVEGCSLKIERAHAALADDRPPPGKLRQVGGEEARAVFPGIYARATEGIPGTMPRGDGEWEMYFYDPEHWRDGATAHRYVVYEGEGGPGGYVLYRQKEDWEGNHPHSEVRIGDLQAVNGEAYRALWRYCFGIDLVHLIKAGTRRLREPLALLLEDPRWLQHSRADHIWLRLLDVAGALAARRYSTEGEVVLEVIDEVTPKAGGRFRLRGGPDGAECARTRRPAEVTIASADLAAAYLGDARLADLAWLGRVQGEVEAVSRAQRMLQWPVQPWCTVHF
jgi:predicted acetyltransferase